jgi:N6-L-threonylcarbamoyladenine synthase
MLNIVTRCGLLSGGHTLIVLARSFSSFQVLADTRDESIGRVIDKVSRMLQIPWADIGPGAALEKFCQLEEESICPEGFEPFHRAMPGKLAFSYSGFHSHLERYIATSPTASNLTLHNRLAIARMFQKSAFEQIEEKLRLVLRECRKKSILVRHLVVSGGVASNSYLRQR